MTITDRLALAYQFESFIDEYRQEIYPKMIADFAKAWRFKRCRTYIQNRLLELTRYCKGYSWTYDFRKALGWDKIYGIKKPDCECPIYLDWSAFDERKTKTTPYIGPEQYISM